MTEDRRIAGEIAPGVRLDDFLPYLLNRIANRLKMARNGLSWSP